MNFGSWFRFSKKILNEVRQLVGVAIRFAISIATKGKGKSGRARVITNFVVTQEAVYYYPFMTSLRRETYPKMNLMIC